MKNRLLFSVMACFCVGQMFAQDHAFFMTSSNRTSQVVSSTDTAWMVQMDDQRISFQSFLEQNRGKVIYLDFWASWCAPCMAEMPFATTLRKKLKKEEVVFAYISIDEEDAAWTRAATRNRLAGEHNFRLVDFRHSNLAKEFGLNAIPRYIIVGKDGEIADMDATRPSEKHTYELLKNLSRN